MTPNDGAICDHSRMWCFEVGCPNGTLADAILLILNREPKPFYLLLSSLSLECEFRRLDRELQRMRKKGLISYDRKARTWSRATVPSSTESSK